MPPSPTFTERARRAQILDAAIAAVNEVGYPRASLSEIASRAGVAKSAIVYYFASKDALLLYVVDHIYTAQYEKLALAVAEQPDPAAKLRAYVETSLRYVDEHRAEIAAGAEIVVSHRGPDGTPLYLSSTEEDSVLLREILSDGMEQGVFRRLPLQVGASLVEGLIDLATMELQRDLEADITALIPEIITFIFRGVSPASEKWEDQQ